MQVSQLVQDPGLTGLPSKHLSPIIMGAAETLPLSLFNFDLLLHRLLFLNIGFHRLGLFVLVVLLSLHPSLLIFLVLFTLQLVSIIFLHCPRRSEKWKTSPRRHP